MNENIKRDLGLAASLALVQLKGVNAGDCFKLIREHTGSSYAELIKMLTRSSKMELEGLHDAQSLLSLCHAINSLNRSIDLDRVILSLMAIHSTDNKDSLSDESARPNTCFG